MRLACDAGCTRAACTTSHPHSPTSFSLSTTPSGNFLLKGMVGDPGEFPQRRVNVFGPHANACLRVAGQTLGIDRDLELLLVGGADDAISLDSPTEKHDRADRPMVFAVIDRNFNPPPALPQLVQQDFLRWFDPFFCPLPVFLPFISSSSRNSLTRWRVSAAIGLPDCRRGLRRSVDKSKLSGLFGEYK